MRVGSNLYDILMMVPNPVMIQSLVQNSYKAEI